MPRRQDRRHPLHFELKTSAPCSAHASMVVAAVAVSWTLPHARQASRDSEPSGRMSPIPQARSPCCASASATTRRGKWTSQHGTLHSATGSKACQFAADAKHCELPLQRN
jgi:hypothetical protein